ncbi:hypothetical protein AVEN_275609-1 [Araneus ventricosus]|uniref:Uncharacterized protein n=1 Tax=Araneus ventricosus TaxID=182803 RepID=A0A4Y2TDY2_ARAVE|nr:hypothetical protein AVEN_143883-1 [Araneus ventricosus]GBN98812.1 hypothetical protein AVEN_180495-1 [Araneus ventricosus]GBN98823.1 hypothetical protein AVEN_224316-1 [Araneus ventricosus]GBN98854.1 hypothetical protein AVEN_275609-1 [Araneus ventricosus]
MKGVQNALQDALWIRDGMKFSGFSLVISTSRVEAARRLFWGGPGNFESRSDDEDDTRAGTPSPNLHTIPIGRRFACTRDLTCNRPHTLRDFCGIGFRTRKPPAPKLDHCGHKFSGCKFSRKHL